jgi:MFS family permease
MTDPIPILLARERVRPGVERPAREPRGRRPERLAESSPDPRRWTALALLCTAFFMVTLDASIGLFALSSLLCGLAWSDRALISARGVQGISAAIMTPSALAIVTTTFPEGSERNKTLGVWGAIGGAGGTAGWLIGGPITSGLGGSGSS